MSDEHETCTYCGVSYPKPISYHHSAEECRTNEGKRLGATSRRSLHDRLGAMIDQIGQPDYSLRELVDGLREIRDELYAVSETVKKTSAERSAENASAWAVIAESDGEMLDVLIGRPEADQPGERYEPLFFAPSATPPVHQECKNGCALLPRKS